MDGRQRESLATFSRVVIRTRSRSRDLRMKNGALLRVKSTRSRKCLISDGKSSIEKGNEWTRILPGSRGHTIRKPHITDDLSSYVGVTE